MSGRFSYSRNPAYSALDAVRFHIGDTHDKDPILYDGEILYLLAQHNQNVLGASIRACEMIAAKYARLNDESVGSVSETWSQKHKHYLGLRDELRRRFCIEESTIYCGGISKTDKETNQDNDDRVEPEFTKREMENTQVAPYISGEDDYDGDGY